MKSILREFFRYSRTEQRGILLLVFLILSVQTARVVYPYLLEKEYPMSEEEARQFAAWALQKEQLSAGVDLSEAGNPSAGEALFAPFRFDPNTIGHNDWLQLGFSEKQAASIEKFIQKGGAFRYREDLKKLYCVTPELYARLESWVDLPGKAEKADTRQPAAFLSPVKEPFKKESSPGVSTPVELNSADTFRLMSIRGIGPYWARRIWKHRERLGGFYSVEQLKEIKGFPDSLFPEVAPVIYADTGLIRKISINTATEEELNKHPYCWYGVAKSIVTYRAKHGPFKHPGDIRKIYSIKPELCDKLVPYLYTE